MPKAVDLFCGSGGFSAGMIDAGIEVYSAFDNWSVAISTYRRNIASHAFALDLSDVESATEQILNLEPDIIAGGPPCQDFSTAGKRSEGKQANLTVAFGEIVARCSPLCFLMENVPQVRLSKTYHLTKRRLARAGYLFAEVVLDASYCGVPQVRKRFFSFGWRKASRDMGGKFLQWIADRQSKESLTVKDYIPEIGIGHYYRHPRNYSRRSVFSVHEPSPTIRGVNRPVPPNFNGNHLDSVPPSTVRPLTSQERSRIQTFPKNWDWGGGGDRNAEVELQIGNAVPVNLSAFVASAMRHALI